MEYSSVSYIH